MSIVTKLAPFFVVLAGLLLQRQLGAQTYALAISVLMCLIVALLVKKSTEKVEFDRYSGRIRQVDQENKGLKDNLMKVYNMMQEQQKPPKREDQPLSAADKLPMPPPRTMPEGTSGSGHHQQESSEDSKPYAQ